MKETTATTMTPYQASPPYRVEPRGECDAAEAARWREEIGPGKAESVCVTIHGGHNDDDRGVMASLCSVDVILPPGGAEALVADVQAAIDGHMAKLKNVPLKGGAE